jgi:hypothetical protein
MWGGSSLPFGLAATCWYIVLFFNATFSFSLLQPVLESVPVSVLVPVPFSGPESVLPVPVPLSGLIMSLPTSDETEPGRVAVIAINFCSTFSLSEEGLCSSFSASLRRASSSAENGLKEQSND